MLVHDMLAQVVLATGHVIAVGALARVALPLVLDVRLGGPDGQVALAAGHALVQIAGAADPALRHVFHLALSAVALGAVDGDQVLAV